jgi:hypothetical protein
MKLFDADDIRSSATRRSNRIGVRAVPQTLDGNA